LLDFFFNLEFGLSVITIPDTRKMPGQENEESQAISRSSSRENQNTQNDEEKESKGLVSPMDIKGPPERRRERMPRSRRREDVGSIARRIYIGCVAASCSLKIKIAVSILLVIFVNIPFIMSRQNSTEIDVVWDPYDLAGCDLLRYNETFDDFMVKIRAIDEPGWFCENSLVS
jgi:hypothetical protein